MPRIRSRVVETESVNQRMLRRGAVDTEHLSPWAVTGDKIKPGQVGGTHLGPQIINESHLHPSVAAIGAGYTITLTALAAQTVSVGGSALELTDLAVGPRPSGVDVTPPISSFTVPASRIVSVLVRFAWVDWRAGGTVKLLRGSTVVDQSPASWGPRFSGVLHAGLVNIGESLSIEVDHGDGSTHDVEQVQVAFKVEGPAVGGDAVTPVAGLYSVFWHSSTGFAITRRTAAGATVLASTTGGPTDGVSYYIRGQVAGNLVVAKRWAITDPEPDWQLSAVDTQALSAGYAGVISGTAGVGSNTRDYALIRVANDSGPEASNDMSGYTVGAGIPTGWERIYGASTDWSVATDAGAPGGKVLRHTVDGVGSHIVWLGGGTGADTDVTVQAKSNDGGLGIGLVMRGTSLL